MRRGSIGDSASCRVEGKGGGNGGWTTGGLWSVRVEDLHVKSREGNQQ